jgi:ATP-dependent helicase/nuclease subunit B
VPAPAVAARPRRLSVTEIETWIRDPYAIYARRVLRLEPLDDLGRVPDAAERGTIVHAVVARFVAEAASDDDLADRGRFAAIAEAELARVAAFPALTAVWRARLAGIGRWLTATEPDRYAQRVRRLTEVAGELPLGPDFTLTGRADRIDRLADDRLVVVDYKTGLPPSTRQVAALLAPQLPLEAAMATAGAFGPDLAGLAVAGLVHVRLSGAGEGGAWLPVAGADVDPAVLAVEARARLEALVARYRDPLQGYASRPRIAFERRLDGPYDHLARVAEWSLGAAEDGEGGP